MRPETGGERAVGWEIRIEMPCNSGFSRLAASSSFECVDTADVAHIYVFFFVVGVCCLSQIGRRTAPREAEESEPLLEQ